MSLCLIDSAGRGSRTSGRSAGRSARCLQPHAKAELHLLLLQWRRKRRIDERNGEKLGWGSISARRTACGVRRLAARLAQSNFSANNRTSRRGGAEGRVDEGRPLSSMSELLDTATRYSRAGLTVQSSRSCWNIPVQLLTSSKSVLLFLDVQIIPRRQTTSIELLKKNSSS